MQTELTCGRYTALKTSNQWTKEWAIRVNQYTAAIVSIDGLTVKFEELPIHFTTADLIEIAALMSNIQRQYKQLEIHS